MTFCTQFSAVVAAAAAAAVVIGVVLQSFLHGQFIFTPAEIQVQPAEIQAVPGGTETTRYNAAIYFLAMN